MEVLIEKKMIEIKSEPLEVMVDNHYHHKSTCGGRRRSSSTPAPASPGPPAAELEPCEEFPILYGLLTAPKSFKPKNSEELQLLPTLELFDDSDCKSVGNMENEGVLVTSRVQLVKCHRRMGSSEDSGDEEEDDEEVDDSEEIYSQNFDLSSRSSSSSPHLVDSSSNLSSPSGESHKNGEEEDDYMSEDESVCSMLMGSPEDNSCSGGDDSLDDNIPTSTTSGFKRKACRLETAIGNIVRRRVRVQKRSSNNINSSNVPISMAPSSPTVSTTCVDPPTPPPSRGRSEILERILRSTNNTTPTQQNNHSAQRSPALQRRAHNNDDINNNDGGYDGPYAKLRDLLTMPEDQLVKRRRLEYGLNENSNVKVYGQNNEDESNNHSQRRREFSPPRNNILASLLQKGRAPYEPTSSASPFNQHHHHPQMRGRIPALVSVNGGSKMMMGVNSRANVIVNLNDDRPYKCSLCDLRFKKLPLLNRHVKTHSHIKRYVCRFCSHAFKRSDNLLAHMRTSCKGIKESDAKFAGQGGTPRPSQNGRNVNANSQNQQQSGQIIPQLLSAPPTAGGPLVSRSQLEEALLLNLRAHHQEDQLEKRYQNNSPLSPLVSTTTASPPPSSPVSSNSSSTRRPADFHSRHSKLLEILSGSPVNRFPVPVVPVDVNEVEEEEQPLPLILRGTRRTSTPACSPSSSSQFVRSHHNQLRSALYPNELPLDDDDEEEQVDSREEVGNDMEEQPLNLGRPAVPASPAPVVVPSVKSRDHPEIVSILSRQPKSNVVMLAAADLRKLVGIDTL